MKFIITITLVVAVSALPHIRESAEDDDYISFRHWKPAPDTPLRLSKPNKDINFKIIQNLLSQLANSKHDVDVDNGNSTPNDVLNALKIIHQILLNKKDKEDEPNNDGSKEGQEAIPPNSDAPEDDKEADSPVNMETENGQAVSLIINEPKDNQEPMSAINNEPELNPEVISPNEDAEIIPRNKRIIIEMMKPEIAHGALDKEVDL